MKIVSAVKVSVLVDNCVWKAQLRGEHGLALLLETPESKVLFDTGQSSEVLMHNAEMMGIDLRQVESVVLSHGHYDHTGGLVAVAGMIGSPRLYAHPQAFGEKYSKHGDNLRAIGCPVRPEELDAKFISVEQPTEVAPGVVATGEIVRSTDFEQIPPHFLQRSGETWIQDLLWDDQALVVRTARGLLVLLGCAHSGVVNILEHLRKRGYKEPIQAMIGGMHLQAADPSHLQQTMHALDKFGVGVVVPLHCTGFRAAAYLARHLGDRYRLGGVGSVFQF